MIVSCISIDEAINNTSTLTVQIIDYDSAGCAIIQLKCQCCCSPIPIYEEMISLFDCCMYEQLFQSYGEQYFEHDVTNNTFYLSYGKQCTLESTDCNIDAYPYQKLRSAMTITSQLALMSTSTISTNKEDCEFSNQWRIYQTFHEDQHKLANHGATVYTKDAAVNASKKKNNLANHAATVSTKYAAVDASNKKKKKQKGSNVMLGSHSFHLMGSDVGGNNFFVMMIKIIILMFMLTIIMSAFVFMGSAIQHYNNNLIMTLMMKIETCTIIVHNQMRIRRIKLIQIVIMIII